MVGRSLVKIQSKAPYSVVVIMKNTVEYSCNEVLVTKELHRKLHNADVAIRMDAIREAMDACDDVQMRKHLAIKLARERHRLIGE